MYCWQLSLNGGIVFGRTWDEFVFVMERLRDRLQLDDKRILPIYVHNLSFEFQFIRKRLTWLEIFSLDEREPVRALCTYGVQFRCSYKLSGYSLSKLGENLTRYRVNKMVGDLDYSLIRTANTPLTDAEMKYCINDVLVVTAYIQERIEIDGNIAKIPMTKTGYVRNACREMCMPKDDKKQIAKYRRLMDWLTVDVEEYKLLKYAYSGGFTHANAFYVGKVMKDVSSYDFTSSYPATMIARKFPMSRSTKRTITSWEQFNYYLRHYCCLFEVRMTGVYAKKLQENYLSSSKCHINGRHVYNNGRIVSADELQTAFTEQDWAIFIKFYQYESIEFGQFRTYKRGYLPKPIIESILQFYEAKTTLKGVDGKEVEYLQGKENVNSIYGMMVTDICRDEIVYDDEWGTMPANIDQAIDRYNVSRKRFLFYPWGVWVTAYSRRSLFTGIDEFDKDYVYSDTDSIKAINAGDHIKYVRKYNRDVSESIDKCLQHYHIPVERSRPKTVKGVAKPLGVWDDEGVYDNFKTLGAKRYMTYKDDKYNITVSGLNKKYAVPYIVDQASKKGCTPFDLFDEGLYIPDYATGKNLHTYIDHPFTCTVTDYRGNKQEVSELTACHIEPTYYTMSLSQDFINYLLGIKDKKE